MSRYIPLLLLSITAVTASAQEPKSHQDCQSHTIAQRYRAL